MISPLIVIAVSLVFLGGLFSLAFYADRKRQLGQSIVANPYVYALAITVNYTAWGFYGSIGHAATGGIDFLMLELGPVLMAFSWWFLLRKIIRISKEQNIVTIADFIASRYGKSVSLGSIITLFAVIGIMPYIALQLKAISLSFNILTAQTMAAHPALPDSAFFVALLLGIFTVLFGARRLDASDRHDGLVAIVAVQALVKLAAMLVVGLFVCYALFDGPLDIFRSFAERFPERMDLFLVGTERSPYANWLTFFVVSMLSFIFLPRQFQIMVVENTSEKHILKAIWFFPLYAFLFSLFVVPLALGGLLLSGGDSSQADFFILHLPLQSGNQWLALLVFIGGLSAGAGMVMVSSVALATMILNHLLMPVILKFQGKLPHLSGLLINLKRLAIMAVIFLGYFSYRLIGESYALANIGMASFLAAAQFAPALIGGLYWKGACRRGARAGLILGFAVWFYTSMVPLLARSGWINVQILEQGLFGIELLRPLALFGLEGLDIWAHSLFWTLFFNIGGYLFFSLISEQSRREREQADKFVDVFNPSLDRAPRRRLSRAPTILEFVDLMTKFIGKKAAETAITEYLMERRIDRYGRLADQDLQQLKQFSEKTLAGSVGSAPARIIVDNFLSSAGSQIKDIFDVFGSVTISRRAGREQLGVLHEVARTVGSGADLQTIFDRILELLRQQFQLDLAVIRLVDDERKVLTVRSHRGLSCAHLASSERSLDTDSYAGEAFMTNSLVTVNNTDLMDKTAFAEIIHDEGIKSFSLAPIVIEDRAVGVLSVFSRSEKGIFTDEFLELYKSVAGQIGIAWRNANQAEQLIKAREKERELEIARTIQSGLLPATTPRVQGLSLAATCLPAHEVGGDYYDFLPRDDSRLDLLIADVSGHSVGAALTMGWIRTFIQDRVRTQSGMTAAEIMAAVNEFFHDDLSRAELFVTMFYVKYEADNGTLIFANAGHNHPVVWKAKTRSLVRLDAEGLIFGVKTDVDYEERRVSLAPGDILILFTDGLTEAEDGKGQFFGEDRLCEILEDGHFLSPGQIIDQLLEKARSFCGTEGFRDDVTLVVMKVEQR